MAYATTTTIGEDGSSLSVQAPAALRYDGHTDEPWESTGLLMALVPPGARILDVGCGTGSVSLFLKRAGGSELVGLEPSSERAEKARSRGLNVLHGAFPTDLLPPNHDFDTVVFADVLEHLPDPAAALRSAKDYLKPNGVILASLPNVAHWSVRWNLVRGRWDYEPCGIMDATHLRWFTKRSLHRLFETSGYHIQSYTVSAGTDLPVYHSAWPWRWFKQRTRDRVIRRGVRWFPRLFGCQHVVRARLA